jgi:hypothetical protein
MSSGTKKKNEVFPVEDIKEDYIVLLATFFICIEVTIEL